MKKVVPATKVWAIILAFGLFAPMTQRVEAGPADPERIEFSKDIIEVNLENKVPANGAKRYIFSGKVGQEIALTVTPKVTGANLSIDLNGKMVTPGKLYSTRVSKAGSFTLQILNADDVNRSFYLDLGVAGSVTSRPSTEPERIEFSKDNFEVNLERTVPANSAKRFVFSGKVGQEFVLTVTPKTSSAKLSIDLNGKTLPQSKLYKTKVSTAGSFTIQVLNFDDVDRPIYLDLGFTVFTPTVDAAAPERIELSGGVPEVNLVKTVPANGAKRLVFSGKLGQKIALTVTPKVAGAKLSVDFNGKILPLGKLYSTSVSKAGSFTIQILNADDVNRTVYVDLGVSGP